MDGIGSNGTIPDIPRNYIIGIKLAFTLSHFHLSHFHSKTMLFHCGVKDDNHRLVGEAVPGREWSKNIGQRPAMRCPRQ